MAQDKGGSSSGKGNPRRSTGGSGRPKQRSGGAGRSSSGNRKGSTPSKQSRGGSGGGYKGSGARGSTGSPKKPTGGRPTGSGGSSSRAPGSKGAGKGRPASNATPAARKRQYTASTRSVEADRRQHSSKRRRDLKGAAVNLPNWVIEAVERVTPADRVAPTLEALGAASEALAEGKYHAAVKHGNRAKALSPQDATTRETIGLAAYRMGDWQTALSELRAFRRMQGETTHLPVEMDVLRAQGRTKDVEAAWGELQKRGGHGLVMNEGKVVYASFLLDEGRADEAWEVARPSRIEQVPNEAHLRLYFVAGRVAAARGDRASARRYADVIVTNDPSFPGYEQLEAEIARLGS